MSFRRSKSNKSYQRKEQGISKRERLKGKQVVKKLFSTGRKYRSGNLVVMYLPAEEPSAGFIASKKIGGAVKRNRVKRILREAYRMNKAAFKGLKVLFYAVGPLELKDVIRKFRHFVRRR